MNQPEPLFSRLTSVSQNSKTWKPAAARNGDSKQLVQNDFQPKNDGASQTPGVSFQSSSRVNKR